MIGAWAPNSMECHAHLNQPPALYMRETSILFDALLFEIFLSLPTVLSFN